MFNRGKVLEKILIDLSRITIIFVTFLVPWNLINSVDKFDLLNALNGVHEVIVLFLAFSAATICLYGYYYRDYITIRLKVFIRGRICKTQRGKTITVISGLIVVVYVLFIVEHQEGTMLDRIDVVATISIAIAALILQYSLRSDGTKKQRERDMRKYLNAIVSRYLENEKMDTNGIVVVKDQNRNTHHYGQDIRVEWSFGHSEPADTSVIIITIKKISGGNSTSQQREYQFIDYIFRENAVYLQCFICYSDFDSEETQSDMSFPITVEYYYDYEWRNIMLSLLEILNQITVEKEFDRISEKSSESELE